VSVASGLFRASLAFAARAASDLLESGSFAFAADALPYADLDRLFRGESTQQTT
jgi:hypothetical protein